MAILKAIVAAALLAGCYSPNLRDCVVACTAADDCAPDQVCGSDGRCAAPDIAGSCSSVAPLPDAAVDARADAALDAPPDAPPLATLVVQIAGKGIVAVTGIGTCNYTAPAHSCTFGVMPGAQVELVATGTGGDEFDRWQSVACTGQDATCTITVVPPSTMVAAKFSH